MADDKQNTDKLDNKRFEQLLKGITKVEILKENETIENVVESIIGDLNIDTEEIQSLITKCTEILVKATHENLLVTELKGLLSQSDLTEDQQKTFLQFWKQERNQIHSHILRQSTFGNKVGQMKWRVDQLTNVKDISESTQTVAIVELTKKNVSNKLEKITFEVDKDTLDTALEQFREIQKRIQSAYS